jgi:two-component system chemotaxis sensor kinase CheA
MAPSTPSNADQFKESFREEAREILVDLETALLELNENRTDQELVGRIFRGLHTVKGSGAMFGFDRMAEFTHDLETAFDEVRNGRLAVSSELIDLTLSAVDQIRAMLEEKAGGPAAGASAACTGILVKVRKLMGIAETAPAIVKKEQAAPITVPVTGAEGEWRIHFAPGPEMMRTGANPVLLVRELHQLGGLAVKASMAALPPLNELDPERCYVSWEMVLSTAAGRDAIRDVFIFVEDACELIVEPASDDSEPGDRNSAHADRPDSDRQAAPEVSESDRTARRLEEARSPSGGRRIYDAPDTASSLRVPAAKLDQFVDLVGELVTVQARLSELSARREDAEVAQVSEEVERLTSALRESAMNVRMMPIRGTFEKFRRLVHDLARDLGKDVELTIEGADTELDKTVIDQLSDPLMHLIRNSMDHGIETPERRAASGKRPTAVIHLSARHAGASVLVAVTTMAVVSTLKRCAGARSKRAWWLPMRK